MTNLTTTSARAILQRPLLNLPLQTVGKDSFLVRQMWTQAYSVSHLSPGGLTQTAASKLAQTLTLDEKLYNSRASAKLKIAMIAMHLAPDWRQRFFAQIDSLLDLDEWDPADDPVVDGSFETLIRMLLLLRPGRRPGLGATSDGRVIAMWTCGNDRLTVTCFPSDSVRWTVVRDVDGDRESAAGQTALPRLLDVLQPYAPQRWFANEGPKDTS